MHPPPRQDYVSISLAGQGSGSYNNSKQWRRQSCWRRILPNKRGPPVLHNRLQKKGNVSDAAVKDKAAESKKEGEEGVISWRGPVIDTDQATQGTKVEENNEDSAANQKAKSSKESEPSRLEAGAASFQTCMEGL
ncbi:hypothetical protein E3U43_000380 [Larimichthys crocea]|uniref:Uncharacterized protein n=1 Tax=Larimichthys crocea TaxID=215358 RepID=A0ACD3Q8H9_LARCR|nr:hypothetical protein E3U43_000380 [Larimichthys crocea]